MSWFSGLADRAENLLNKLDENAAQALKETPQRSSSPKPEQKQPRTEIPAAAKTRHDNLKPRNVNKKRPNKAPDAGKPAENEHKISIRQEEANFEESQNHESKDDETLIRQENRMQALESENKMLQNELCIINEQVSVLVKKARNVEKSNDTLECKLFDLQKKYNEAVQENGYNQSQSSNSDTSSVLYLKDENQHLIARIKELEDSTNKLELALMSATSLTSKLENELKASQNSVIDLELQLAQSRDDVIKAEKDLETHKIRAKGLLAVKEKIIEEMQTEDVNDSTRPFVAQIEYLKSERDELTQSITNVYAEYEELRKNIQQSETQYSSSEKTNQALREAAREERTAREKAEQLLSSLTSELKSMQIETTQQLAVLHAKLRDRDSEVQKYQLSQTASYPNGSASERDTTAVENVDASRSCDGDSTVKLHRLTQALVAKQAALDSMMADRNALRLQLEKTENKYRSDLVAAQNNRLKPRIINLHDNVTDDVKASSRHGIHKRSGGTIVSNTFHDASTAFSKTSLKIGVFFRRHPMMRMLIFGYMVLLHLWVLVVIVTYSPEVHPV